MMDECVTIDFMCGFVFDHLNLALQPWIIYWVYEPMILIQLLLFFELVITQKLRTKSMST